ncbi:hypothetical protein C5167_021047, partial [Papaver somniferum]
MSLRSWGPGNEEIESKNSIVMDGGDVAAEVLLSRWQENTRTRNRGVATGAVNPGFFTNGFRADSKALMVYATGITELQHDLV